MIGSYLGPVKEEDVNLLPHLFKKGKRKKERQKLVFVQTLESPQLPFLSSLKLIKHEEPFACMISTTLLRCASRTVLFRITTNILRVIV